MKTIAFVLLFSILLVFVEPAARRNPRNTSKDHKSHCYDEYNGPMEKGEHKAVSGCRVATCQDDGKIAVMGCGFIYISPSCHGAEGDPSKPYPECCYTQKCPEMIENRK